MVYIGTLYSHVIHVQLEPEFILFILFFSFALSLPSPLNF